MITEDSDNGNVSKVVLSLVSVLEEVERLTRAGSSSLLSPLIAFSQSELEDQQAPPTAAGRLLPHFHELNNYLDHSRDVMANLLSQLAVLLTGPASPVKLSPGRLEVVWTSLARLLSVMAELDLAVTSPALLQAWLHYKRMVKALRNEPEKFGSTIEVVRQLEKVLLDLEKTVLGGNMLQSLLSVKIDVGKSLIDELTNYVRQFSTELEKDPASLSERFLPLCCLAALLRKMSGQQDRKLVSKLWDLVKKLPGCGVVSEAGVVWTPELFFQRFLSQSADSQSSQEKKFEANIENTRKVWFSSRLSSLATELKGLLTEISAWRARLTTRLPRDLTALQLTDLAERTQLVLAGLGLANTANLLTNSCINFFTKFEQPLTKSVISSLGDLMVAVKMIQETFRSVTASVTEVCVRSGQHTQFLVLNLIQTVKKGLVSDRKYSDERIDILSCLLIAEKALAGPVSSQRTRVARLALSLASGGRFGLREEDCRQMLHQLSVLEKLGNINQQILAVCSTNFLSVLHPPHNQIISAVLQGLSHSLSLSLSLSVASFLILNF